LGVHHGLEERERGPATARRGGRRSGHAVGALRVRVVPLERVLDEELDRVDVSTCREVLKGADAQVTARDAREHRARQHLLAVDRVAREHRRERAGRRHAERVHRLAEHVLAEHRSDRRAPVTAARERCRPRSLQLNVAARTGTIDELAEQDRAAVAELRNEAAELMTRVGERDRIRVFGQSVAGEDRDALGAREGRGIEPELVRERRVDRERDRRAHRARGRARVEAAGERGVAMLEAETHPRFVGPKRPSDKRDRPRVVWSSPTRRAQATRSHSSSARRIARAFRTRKTTIARIANEPSAPRKTSIA